MENVNALSDSKILENLKTLSARENEVTCEIILYLIEMESRKLYLERGYSSLFEFCTRALGYSEPAALRRITAARCSREHLQVYESLKEKKITLSSIAVFSSIISKENLQTVLQAVEGKSKREVELYVSAFRPVKKVIQSIKPITVELPPVTSIINTSSGDCDNPVQTSEPAPAKEVETRYKLNFSIPEPVMKKLKVAQALSSKGHDLSGLFEVMLDSFIESKRPKKASSPRDPALRTRYLSKATREDVFQRDEYRCAYEAPDGTRCESRVSLQIDHIEPFAKGGSRNPDNLRCLCKKHNRYMAEKEFGTDYMEKFY